MRYGWTLEQEPWKRLAEMCAARKWRRTYLEYSYTSEVPAAPGVYVICASIRFVVPTTSINRWLYNAVYAGQAKDLRRRFREHSRSSGMMGKARETFRRLDYCYTRADPKELNELEQTLLETLGPSANERNVRARIGEPVSAGSA